MNKKVLVVDDSMFMRSLIKNILYANGYTQVLEASSPKEAIKIYKEQRPKVVTMDITMETSGVDCVKDLKKIDNKAKIIMVSALAEEPYIRESFENGACDFIAKPFTVNRVLKAVNAQVAV